MDNLRFIDSESAKEEYRHMAEKLFAEELRKLDTTQKHPEVIKILNSVSARASHILAEEVFDQYQEFVGSKRDSKKRTWDSTEADDAFLEEYKKKHPRIDMSVYGLDQYSTGTDEAKDRIATVDSYLSHQLIALRDLIPKTMVNQWAINNDLMRVSSDVVDNLLETQRKQLQDLDKYRQNAQTSAAPTFKNLEYQVNELILDEIERHYPQQDS